jgi:hypothetical protein
MGSQRLLAVTLALALASLACGGSVVTGGDEVDGAGGGDANAVGASGLAACEPCAGSCAPCPEPDGAAVYRCHDDVMPEGDCYSSGSVFVDEGGFFTCVLCP